MKPFIKYIKFVGVIGSLYILVRILESKTSNKIFESIGSGEWNWVFYTAIALYWIYIFYEHASSQNKTILGKVKGTIIELSKFIIGLSILGAFAYGISLLVNLVLPSEFPEDITFLSSEWFEHFSFLNSISRFGLYILFIIFFIASLVLIYKIYKKLKERIERFRENT